VGANLYLAVTARPPGERGSAWSMPRPEPRAPGSLDCGSGWDPSDRDPCPKPLALFALPTPHRSSFRIARSLGRARNDFASGHPRNCMEFNSTQCGVAPSTSQDMRAYPGTQRRGAPMDGPSFRLDEWLTYRRVSRSEWYRLRAANNAPETYGQGRMQRITMRADRAWVQKQKRLARARQTSTGATATA
jgi:hypothetical protein